MKSKKDKRFEEIIDEVSCDHCHNQYCFLKKYISSLHPKTFVLVQLKCLEMFKWEESERVGHEVEWNDIAFMWSDLGYASAFRASFNEDLSVREIYRRTMALVNLANSNNSTL